MLTRNWSIHIRVAFVMEKEWLWLGWMLQRYGDSSVMHADGPRFMWPWRDWVINAYNSNMPFDQFTVEQIAGDLLPGATVDQKLPQVLIGITPHQTREEQSLRSFGLSMLLIQSQDHIKCLDGINYGV